MIYHFVVGDEAAKPLTEAIFTNADEAETVIVLKDILHVGPLLKEEGQKFSALRAAFWQEVSPQMKEPVQVDDLERVLQTGNELSKSENAQIWFWMAPSAADTIAYFWLLFYLKKYRDRFSVVNTGGLPFLDDNGKLFYPKNISEISPKELLKAKKLARIITPSEMEVDTEEWEKLRNANDGIRVYEGGKKISGKGSDHYDQQLLSFCSHQYQKASKILRQAMSKYSIPTGDTFLAWRLRQLAANEQLSIQGDALKAFNEWDVKLTGGEPALVENTTSDNQQQG